LKIRKRKKSSPKVTNLPIRKDPSRKTSREDSFYFRFTSTLQICRDRIRPVNFSRDEKRKETQNFKAQSCVDD